MRHLPLSKECRNGIDSDVAAIKNVASPASADSENGYTASGTGYGVVPSSRPCWGLPSPTDG